MTEMSRIPAIDISDSAESVLQDIESTSTDFLNCFSFSFCATPKRCSSS